MKRKDFIKYMGLAPLAMKMDSLNDLAKFTDNLAPTKKMPVLFIGHGSPMNGIEENQFTKGFADSVKDLPQKPNAILCISAHWLTRGTKVTAMAQPQTIHDFGGFPEKLYQQQYLAKGDPELAKTTQQLLLPTPVELDNEWGLDHGTWTVLKHMYPKADIPVIQLSIDYYQDATYHFDLAKRLDALRSKGILIMGSGNIVHNLRMVDWNNMDKNYGYDWAHEARESINKNLLDGNFKPLLDFNKQGQAYKLAIPTPDHYFPMIYTLGLKQSNDKISLFNDEFLGGSLSMTSFKIG